jgi:hypothetical protein
MKTFLIIFMTLATLCLATPLNADSTGTGFFVSGDGYIVTNYHVVEGSSRLLVKHLDETLTATVVAVDRQNDIALLKVPKTDHPFPHLSVNMAAIPTPGSDVFTIGFPDPMILGLTPKTTRGNVTASAGIKDDPRFLQISVPIQPGNSGGPLVDLAGSVIGITTATIDAINRLKDGGYLPQNINYALKASYLKGVFDQVADNKLGIAQADQKERKFDEIQRATQESVALIIAINQAPPAKADTSNGRPKSIGTDSRRESAARDLHRKRWASRRNLRPRVASKWEDSRNVFLSQARDQSRLHPSRRESAGGQNLLRGIHGQVFDRKNYTREVRYSKGDCMGGRYAECGRS